MDPAPTGASASPTPRGALAPRAGAAPHDRCVRCGTVTPAGVSLCPDHNPGRIRGPSSTQMHATILAGVLGGFLAFFLVARMFMSPAGPFGVEVTSRVTTQAGGVVIGFSVANEGSVDGVADCRVTRDGIPRPDDLAFRTERIPAGGSVTLERTVDPPAGAAFVYDARLVDVSCS